MTSTQWMIRLNNTEIVGWFCFDQSIQDAWYEDPEDVLEDITFGSIIAAALTSDQIQDQEDMITVRIARKPIRRGLWLDRNFIRTTFQHSERLPYEGPYEWPLMDLQRSNEE
jgi:hypothetical protein